MQESKVISNHVLIANKTKGEIKKLPWIYTTKETQTWANNKYTGKLQDKILCTTNFITRVIYCITMKLQINLILKVCSPQSWWRISVTGILRSTFYESQLTTLKKSLTKIQISRAFWFISFLQCGADSISRPLAGYEAFSFTFSRFMGDSKFHRN